MIHLQPRQTFHSTFKKSYERASHFKCFQTLKEKRPVISAVDLKRVLQKFSHIKTRFNFGGKGPLGSFDVYDREKQSQIVEISF